MSKKHSIITIITALLLSTPAHAEEQSGIDALCQQLKQQQQNQSADYTPGLDVHGNAVVSADINSAASTFLNDPVSIPIEIDLIKQFGLTLPAAINLSPTISTLHIYQDGTIRYNQEDITERVTNNCTAQNKDHVKNTENIKQDDRQAPRDFVGSSDKIEGQYPPKK